MAEAAKASITSRYLPRAQLHQQILTGINRMPVTVNSKTILLNERILFKEGQTIMIEDKIPIRMSANSESSEKIGLEGAGNVFDLSINGMSASSFDRITSGSGSWKGEPFEYIIHSIFVGALGGVKIYEVSITAYQI